MRWRSWRFPTTRTTFAWLTFSVKQKYYYGMKNENYYTPEEAIALKAKSEAVDYFFRDAIAHYSPKQKKNDCGGA